MTAALLCPVVAISDGDTLTARCGDQSGYQQVTVRISAIDVPERCQDFGERSRQALAELGFQQTAKIRPGSLGAVCAPYRLWRGGSGSGPRSEPGGPDNRRATFSDANSRL